MIMTNLIVRNVDENIVKALKERANKSGNSAEMEHRIILSQVLLKPQKKSLVEVLLQIPRVGNDSDFKRKQETEKIDVFA